MKSSFGTSLLMILVLVGFVSAPQARASFDPVTEALAEHVSASLVHQAQALLEPLSHPPKDCSDPEAGAGWLRALYAKGSFKSCVAFAQQCLAENPPGVALDEMLFNGGSCAEALYRFQDAYALYDQATAPQYQARPGFEGHVFIFAQFAQFTDFPSMTLSILQRAPEWADAEASSFALDVLSYLNTGDPGKRTSQQLDGWIQDQIARGEAVLKRHLMLAWTSHLMKQKYQYADALAYLGAHVDEFTNPHAWFGVAYQAFYDQDTANFMLARRVYDAYIPFARTASWLPTELNTSTYEELYSDTCHAQLTQGAAYTQFQNIKNSWASGTLSATDALARTQALLKANPGTADLLTLLGGLQDRLGQEKEAISSYWQAQKLCPYFDRAHWGLERVHYRQKERAFKDYSASLARIDREVSGIVFPPELSKYVINWAALDSDAQKRFKYAIRFWAPFVSRLYASGARIYVKAGVQNLSDVPGLEDLKNVRIEYDHDNRLWDDVRGAGGKTVSVDYDQMMDGGFGDFNLAGHEVTHQFQGTTADISLFPADQFACSVALYNAAAKRALFADPYAGRNFLEYLAQGVAYFMIPDDSPARYGLNVSWERANDPDLYAFLSAMQTQSQSLGQLKCPIAH